MRKFPDDLACLVISLRRSADRRELMSKQLSDRGYPFSFVDAIDAKSDLTPEVMRRVDIAAMRRRGRRENISNGEIACALSHAAAYRAFLKSDKSYALIFEDDAIPTEGLDHVIETGSYRSVPMLLGFHGNARVRKSGSIDLGNGITARPLVMNPFGAVGYFLDQRTAEALAQATATISGLADWPVEIARLNAHVALPKIVGHPPLYDRSQSLLEAERVKPRKRRALADYFSKKYLLRKWWKFRGDKVS